MFILIVATWNNGIDGEDTFLSIYIERIKHDAIATILFECFL